MSDQNPPAISSLQISDDEMAKDHAQILQHYFDSLLIRRFSPKTIETSRWFIQRWFGENGVVTGGTSRPLHVWEAMKPLEGRIRIKNFLLSLSTPGEDGLPVLQASTVRAYASHLQRLFTTILEFVIY